MLSVRCVRDEQREVRSSVRKMKRGRCVCVPQCVAKLSMGARWLEVQEFSDNGVLGPLIQQTK